MTQRKDRFDRNIRLFGSEGQQRLARAHVTILGVGGLGSHVVQQLALLGVGALSLVDDEEISVSNKNRYIGVRHEDPVPGTVKVDVAARLVGSIDPGIRIITVPQNAVSAAAFDAIKAADYVFRCFDDDGPRFVVNDVATAYGKVYIDVATDVVGQSFGGRIVIKDVSPGCLYCFDELDLEEVQ